MSSLQRPEDVPVGVTLDRTCIGCDDVFQWTSQPGRQWPVDYCSKPCRRRTRRRARVERRVQLDTPDAVADGMRLLMCARCGRWFGWTPPPRESAEWESEPAPPLYHTSSCKEKAKEDRKKGQWAARQEARQARAVAAEEDQRRREEVAQAARIAEMSATARALLLPAARCVGCGKVASPTKDEAKRAKRDIEARTGRTNEVRYYQCEDGWWHWTRMDATLDGWRARQEAAR